MRRAIGIIIALGTLCGNSLAQIDPYKRELIQLGYNQAFQGHQPLSGYAFYFINQPNFFRSNLTLRLAVAPVFLDSELGITEALGPHTHLGIGMAGGGFADSYSEIRQGKYLPRESFDGHGGQISLNVYHLFNPAQRVPLNAVLRAETRYSFFSEGSDTDPTFELPEDRPMFLTRAGLRLGGQEPLMLPDLAMELSVWYQGQYRADASAYGFGNDRVLNPNSHLFWARALFAYTITNTLKHSFRANFTLGTSIDPDRFSAYRLGGFLPLASEFPLDLPGYYYEEISAKRYALFGVNYDITLDPAKRFSALFSIATSAVKYVDGLEQPGNWHSGAGAGMVFRSKSGAWQLLVAYGYGIDAIRNDHRGAHSIGFLLQFDLDRAGVALLGPDRGPGFSRGLLRIFD